METVKTVKTVSIPYRLTEEIRQLVKDFRSMVNYCLEAGLKNRVTGRFGLTRLVYGELQRHGYHSWYVLSAIEVATALLKNHRKAKRKNFT